MKNKKHNLSAIIEEAVRVYSEKILKQEHKYTHYHSRNYSEKRN